MIPRLMWSIFVREFHQISFFWSSHLKRGHGELAGAEAEDDDGGGAERDERRDEVGARGRGRVVRVQRQLVVAR